MEVQDYERPTYQGPERSNACFYFPFVKDGIFKLRVGSTFSHTHLQEIGVPQGSIMSVTLFSEKINSNI